MQSAYSMYGTRIHLVLKDEIADAYNRALDAFLEAQDDHKERTGVQWNPKIDPTIVIDWTKEEQAAFNGMARILNVIAEVNGGLDIPEEEITSDYLVKL